MVRTTSSGVWRRIDNRLFAINSGLLGCLLGAVFGLSVGGSTPIRILVGTATALALAVALYRLLSVAVIAIEGRTDTAIAKPNR
jgi:hypothetical protein